MWRRRSFEEAVVKTGPTWTMSVLMIAAL